MQKNQDWLGDNVLYLALVVVPAIIGGAAIVAFHEMKAGSCTLWSALGLGGTLLLFLYLTFSISRRSRHSTAIAFIIWPILAWIGGAALRVAYVALQ